MSGEGATVLFVEDETELRLPVVYALDLAGFSVLSAATGEDALEILRLEVGRVDWLFTDIRLPGLVDGWRVADEFRCTCPLRPVIFATARRRSGPGTATRACCCASPTGCRTWSGPCSC